MLPKVSIVGRPNAGKSTLFNRILGYKVAITSKHEGTTRDRVFRECEINGINFELIDTGGIEMLNPDPSSENLDDMIQNEIWFSIIESDIIIFLVDSKSEITSVEEDIFRKLRKSDKTIIFALNKVDNPPHFPAVKFSEFFKFGEPILISSLHGYNIDSFIEVLHDTLKSETEILENIEVQQEYIKLAILGRPNAGKSTLFNQFSENNKSIANKESGTTRDPIWGDLFYKNQHFKIWDTAGIRRKSKVNFEIEYFSNTRAFQIIQMIDIVILVIDSQNGEVSKQDLELLDYINRYGKGVVVFLNKWDEIADQKEKYGILLRERIEQKLGKQFTWIPTKKGSAKTGKNIQKILDEVLKIQNRRTQIIDQYELNQFLLEISQMRYPIRKVRAKTKLIKIKQKFHSPPCFEIVVNRKDLFDKTFERFVIKRLRKRFDFEGSPIYIDIEDPSTFKPKN